MFLQIVISKKSLKRRHIMLASCQPLTKKAGSGSGSFVSGADPDPYKNVMDPKHRLILSVR
jgi:hypothetical protein